MANFVTFELFEESPNGKTKIWLVKNTRSTFVVGKILWCVAWSRYIFRPKNNCLFDPDRLAEITSFLIEQTHTYELVHGDWESKRSNER